jgi:tripartite-type tricarboxylate transporter receptor subunit TctC
MALAGGCLDYGCASIVGSQSQLDAKVVRATAISGSRRELQIPDVPTIGELGYPDASFLTWQGLFDPKATPQPIFDNPSQAFRKVSEGPAVRAVLVKMLQRGLPQR